jgi:DNA-binding MarR family transcriptional regulator
MSVADAGSTAELTRTQFLVLSAVQAGEKIPMGVLATSLKKSLPTLTGLVDRLIDCGYLARYHDDADRRLVLVGLSPKGRALLRHFEEEIGRAWGKILSELPEEELAIFGRIIGRLLGRFSSQ